MQMLKSIRYRTGGGGGGVNGVVLRETGGPGSLSMADIILTLYTSAYLNYTVKMWDLEDW